MMLSKQQHYTEAMAQALFGLQNAFTSAVGEIIRFDQAVQDNIAVLNKSKSDATALAKNVVSVGKSYGIALDEIQQGMLTVGRAGVEGTAQLKEATEVLTALAVLTGDAMSEGAEFASSMLAVYPQLADNVGDLGDKMGAVANATRLGLKDFSTISNYALVAAKNIGLSSDAYLALNGALSKVGLNASTIGTSIRRLGVLLTGQTKSTKSFFDATGISQKKLAEAIRNNSASALAEFSKKLKELSPKKFQEMTGAMDVLTRSTVTALKEMDFAKMYEEVDKARSVTEQASESAKGFERAWVSAKIKMTESLKSAFEPITKKLNEIINSSGKKGPSAIQAFADAIKAFGTIVVKVMSVVLSAINGVMLTLGTAVAGLSKLAGAGSQILGQTLGGISTEEYQNVSKEISKINEELDKLEAGDKRRLKLRTQRAKLRKGVEAYEKESGVAANLIKAGEELRSFGDGFQENVLKGAVEMDGLAKSMAGIDTSVKSVAKNVKKASDAAGKASKDINENQDITGTNNWKNDKKGSSGQVQVHHHLLTDLDLKLWQNNLNLLNNSLTKTKLW